MTNANNHVIYTGVTNDLDRRLFEHKNKTTNSFTARYNIKKLVFFESFNNIHDAFSAEKKIKAGSRAKKIELIVKDNPNWKDLAENK